MATLAEPKADTDEAFREEVRSFLSENFPPELKGKGKTVFLITHRPGAVQLADQLLLLRDGQVQLQGPRDAVLAQLRAAQPPARPAPASQGSALPMAS